MQNFKTILLEQGKYLSDIKFPETFNKHTLIQAGTGMGKTSKIMDGSLTEYKLIIQLVPSILKVKELESKYSGAGKIQYLFFYDKMLPTKQDFTQKKQTIVVCTYDKLKALLDILSEKQLQSCLLVVDECHKLYSAGNYRDTAINTIIMSIRDSIFKSILFLTATFTPNCWETLHLPLTQSFQVRQEKNDLKRNVELILLKKGDQYSFLSLVAKRLKQCITQDKRKKIIIRLNNRVKCERIAAALEKYHNVKTLVIHSKKKYEQDIQLFFSSQQIPPDIDVVLCTSIMDEAININNLEEEMDSLFVIGKDAHPEELVQFLGRLRKTSVPCFLVQHTTISEDSRAQIKKLQQNFHEKNTAFITKLEKISSLISELIDSLDLNVFGDGEPQKQNVYQKINKLNETFNELSGAKLFSLYKGKVCRNSANIAANYYRMDKANCYENFYYLKYRITELLPSCMVKYSVDHVTQTPSYLKEFLEEEKLNSEKAYNKSISPAFEIFLTQLELENINQQKQRKAKENGEYVRIYPSKKSDGKEPEGFIDDGQSISLKEFASSLLAEHKNNESYFDSIVSAYKVPHHAITVEILTHITLLATVIGNLNDIYEIIKRQECSKILTVSKAYNDNIVVQYLLKRFYRYSFEKCFAGNFKLSPNDAVAYIEDAFKQLHKNTQLPMKTILQEQLVSGVKVDYKTKEVTIIPSKAANFIVKFFEVLNRNAKKPTEQRFLEFKGIALGDYEYLCLSNVQKFQRELSKHFVLLERYFDARTGVFLSGPSSSLEPNLFFEDDYFDE